MEHPPTTAPEVSGRGQPQFRDALAALSRTLAELAAPSMLIGGVAVIASGVPRTTVDIDATVLAGRAEPEPILEIAERHGLRARVEHALDFAHAHHVLLMEHQSSGIPIDITLASLPFEEEAIAASVEVSFGGIHIRVPRPDDLLVYKVVASRPRDLDDAEQLLLLYGPSLDLTRIRRVIREFSEALQDSRRLDEWDRLIQRAGLSS